MDNEVFDVLLFDDARSAQHQKTLQAALAEDPALAEAFAYWQGVRAAVRNSLDTHVPDRRLLVLYALEADGQAALLTDAEQQYLSEARTRLAKALEAHPSLQVVVEQIQAAAVDFESIWQAYSLSDHHERQPTPARAAPDRVMQPRRARSPVLRWAARAGLGVAVAAFAVVLILVFQRDQSRLTIRTAEGEVRRIELVDGSTVRLLGNTELSYVDPDARLFNRRVRLEGQAFFDVMPGEQGFVVETPTALSTALGTSFGIRAGAEMTEVVLVSGRVALAPRAVPDRMVVVEEGQMSRVGARALPATPVPVDLNEALDWPGLFVFRTLSLAEATARLGQHYGATIRLASGLMSERVSGTFGQDQSLKEILLVLAATLGAELRGDAVSGYLLVPATEA